MSRLLQTIEVQGQVCAAMGSAMYGDLLPQIGNDVEADGVFARIFAGHENDSGRMALPLRLLGGLHRLALDGRAPGLGRWYPSAGGEWNAEAAWPDAASQPRSSPRNPNAITWKCLPRLRKSGQTNFQPPARPGITTSGSPRPSRTASTTSPPMPYA